MNVLVRDHSFTAHPGAHPQMEWTMPASALYFHPHSTTALWPAIIGRPTEGRRLSWPGWLLVMIPLWYARRRRSPISILMGPGVEYETNALPLRHVAKPKPIEKKVCHLCILPLVGNELFLTLHNHRGHSSGIRIRRSCIRLTVARFRKLLYSLSTTSSESLSSLSLMLRLHWFDLLWICCTQNQTSGVWALADEGRLYRSPRVVMI